MKIKRFRTDKEVILACAKDIGDWFLQMNKKLIPVFFCLSGGSSLSVLDNIQQTAWNKNITIGLLDERVNAKDRTFEVIKTMPFYQKIQSQGVRCIDLSFSQDEDENSLALKMEQWFSGWQKENLGGQIGAIIGMGVDGHIAGIMPYPEDCECFKKKFLGKSLFVGYDAFGKNKIAKRATATISFFKKIDQSFGFVVGEKKQGVLRQVFVGSDLCRLPARIFQQLHGNIYTDITE